MTIEKFQKYIIILLLILLPSQPGLHFWPAWSLVNGVRVDYFSPTLYLNDVLILFLLILEIFNFQFSIFNKFSFRKLLNLRLLIYCLTGLLVLLNVTTSLSPSVSIYKWFKVLEFGFLGYWIAKNVTGSLGHWVTVLLVPIFYESALTLWQFFSQASVGGLWYFLGERTFNSGTPGIANAYINGTLVLRPYGTFPHPNVLGGFLAVVLPLLLTQIPRISRKSPAVILLIYWVTVLLGYSALFLTLSRSAILVGVGASFVAAFPRFQSAKKSFAIGLIGLIGLIFLIWPRLSSLRTETEPLIAREQLNSGAMKQWARSPLIGTGLGTSPLYQKLATSHQQLIRNYALAFQPVHNIYLLLLSETGILGLGVFVILTIFALRRASPVIRNTLYVILLLGLFDHYWLTLQQGQLILTLVMGLSLRRQT